MESGHTFFVFLKTLPLVDWQYSDCVFHKIDFCFRGFFPVKNQWSNSVSEQPSQAKCLSCVPFSEPGRAVILPLSGYQFTMKHHNKFHLLPAQSDASCTLLLCICPYALSSAPNISQLCHQALSLSASSHPFVLSISQAPDCSSVLRHCCYILKGGGGQ